MTLASTLADALGISDREARSEAERIYGNADRASRDIAHVVTGRRIDPDDAFRLAVATEDPEGFAKAEADGRRWLGGSVRTAGNVRHPYHAGCLFTGETIGMKA